MRSIGFLVIAAVFLLPTAASSGPAVVNGPLLAPGDTWTYGTNTSLATGLSLDGHVRLAVTAHGATEVGGRTYDAYVMSVSGSGSATGTFATQFGSTRASGEWTVSGREILDAHGLEILSSVIDLEANGTLHTNPIPLPFALSVQNTTSYRLEGDPWQFPLAVGATASLSTRMNFSEDFRLVYYGVSPTPTHVAGRQGPGRQQAGSDPPRPDPGSLSSEDDPTHAVRVLAGTSDKPRGPDLGTGLRRAGKGGGPLSPSVPPDESDAHRDDSDRGKGPSVRREAEEGGRFERLVPVADEVRGPDRRRAVVGLGPGIVPRDRSEEGNHE